MPDVTISYKGSSIATMDASGTKTLQTSGKYCEADISVQYVKSGGLPADSAVIHVIAPAGSTIEFAKGGVTVETLGPNDGHISAADNTIAEWYYSVGSTNYGTWTVTATLSGDTASDTVSVSAAVQYDIELSFFVAGYSPLSYIESSGTQYLNLSLGASKNLWALEYVCDIRIPSQGKISAAMFGNRDSSQTMNCPFINPNNGSLYPWTNTSGGYAGTAKDSLYGTRFVYKVSGSSGTVTIYNDATSWASGSRSALNKDHISMFCRTNNDDSHAAYITARAWSIKIYDTDHTTLLLDLVPAMRNSDSAVGMIDLVNRTFYGNAGTGTFAYAA